MALTILEAGLRALAAVKVDSDRPCCVFVRAVLRLTYGATAIDSVKLSKWNLWPGESAWSPVEACKEAGIADLLMLPPAAPTPAVGRWHVAQGWRGTPFAAGVSGHTFLWFAGPDGWGVQLDSAEARWRPAPSPGPEIRFRRWADVARPYVGGVAVAVLREP